MKKTKKSLGPKAWFRREKRYFFPLLTLLITITIGHFGFSKAASQTYTVCASGCDYTTISNALAAPGLSYDIIQPTAGYVYDPLVESSAFMVPTTVTLQCLPGAATIGQVGQPTMSITMFSHSTVQGCSFENVNIGGNNSDGDISILGNTFSGNSPYEDILLFHNDSFAVNDNVGINQLSVEASDNGTVRNNTFDTTYPTAQALQVLGDGLTVPSDYLVLANVPEYLLVENNTFNNHVVNSNGDWIRFGAGAHIDFNGNTVQSAVTIANNYITMLTISNAQVALRGNYFITPKKTAGANTGTWAINLRAENYNIDATVENNTIYEQSDPAGEGGDACIGYFDDGSHSNLPVTLTANYNLCYQSNATPGGNGFSFNYTSASTNLTFTNSFNGIYNADRGLSDSTGTYNSLNANTKTSNPLFRRENVATDDDLFLNPISAYLDVDGTTDIGAYSAARTSTILLDDNCTVDYASCDGQSTALLAGNLWDGDTVQLADGTYAPFTVDGPLANLSIQGTGAGSVIDASGGSGALRLNKVSNSQVQNLKVQNASSSTHQYFMTSSAFSTASQDYNTFGGAGYLSLGCSLNLIAPNTDVTAFDGVGTQNINLFLAHVPDAPNPDQFVTVYVPANLASTPAEIATACGFPAIFFEKVVAPVFTLSGGNYVLNTAGLASAGVFPTGGAADPVLTGVAIEGTGIGVLDSNGNTFTGITSLGNKRGASFEGTSANNTFVDSTILGNSVADFFSHSSGDNAVQQTAFNLQNTQITGTGLLNIYFKAKAFVRDYATHLPLANVAVAFTDAQNLNVGNLVTDATGNTPLTGNILAMALSQATSNSELAGGKNPLKITVSAADYITGFIQANLNALNQQFSLEIQHNLSSPVIDSVPGSGGGGSGGGGGGGGGSGLIPQTHPSAPTITVPTFPGYKDLLKTDRDYNAFAYAYAIGAVRGNPDGKVLPNQGVQRDQVAKIITVAFGLFSDKADYCAKKSPFPDVRITNWAAQYVCLAKSKLIITGYKDGMDKGFYVPSRIMNRVEFLAILLRNLKDITVSMKNLNYTDIAASAWYTPYAAFAYQEALFDKKSLLQPEKAIARREVVRLLYALHLKKFL